MKNIVVFASGNGTDLQAIMDACDKGVLNARVCAVISDKPGAKALERARNAGIDAYHVSVAKSARGETEQSKSANERTNASDRVNADAPVEEVLNILATHKTDIIFLAGYLRKIDPRILEKYQNRVFNIHPALLPKYGGKGMYGIHAHEAVIRAGDKESGVTIHRVNEEYDAGDIVARTIVPVEDGDTAETLAARVLEREHEFIVEVLGDIIDGKILLG